jgi:FkbM family methyltransferase
MQTVDKSQRSQVLIEGIKQAGNSRKLAGLIGVTLGMRSVFGYVERWATKRGLHIRLAQVLHDRGIDIRKTDKSPNTIDFINDRKVDTALDVGDNSGQFGMKLRHSGYKRLIVSFEPTSLAFKYLEENARADGNWLAHNCAIGSEEREVKINVFANHLFSSVFNAKDNAKDFHSEVLSIISKRFACRLSTRSRACITGISWSKIDTQGSEQVIEGGRLTLAKLTGVFMELPVISLYEGTWRFGEAIDYMRSLGFVVTQLNPVNYHPVDPQALVEIDCLFRRRDERLDLAPNYFLVVAGLPCPILPHEYTGPFRGPGYGRCAASDGFRAQSGARSFLRGQSIRSDSPRALPASTMRKVGAFDANDVQGKLAE